MKNNVFKVVLLQALPASGKSEVRNFMAHVEPERLQNEFHIGENLQLDDFPYVHMMRRIDNELLAMGEARIFYPGEEPFIDGRDWGTLCALLNELFLTLYPNEEGFLAAATNLQQPQDDMQRAIVPGMECNGTPMLFIIEDCFMDLGVVTGTERGFQRILEIVTDYLSLVKSPRDSMA